MTARIDGTGESYEEREIVALFADEGSLAAAVDALIGIGFTREDFSVLAHRDSLVAPVGELEDSAGAPRAGYVSHDARVEGAAAAAGAPALVAGLGGAWAVGAVGTALVPAIAITAGSAAGLAVAGLLFARFFGRRHAERIREQIDAGGLLLWIRADAARDAAAFEILRGLGAKDVHVHLLAKHWGVENVPLHDANPDPLLGASPRPTGL